MLISFAVMNYRSFGGNAQLSMVRPPAAGRRARETWRRPEVSALAAIYGPNASGRTSFVRAVQTLRDLASGASLETVEPHAGNSPKERTQFQVEFLASDDIHYRYTLNCTRSAVSLESLEAYYSARPTTLFHRSSGKDGVKVSYSPRVKGEKKVFQYLTAPHQLLLERFSLLQANPFAAAHHFLTQEINVGSAINFGHPANSGRIARHLHEDSSYFTRVAELIRRADVGIEGLRVEERSAGQLDVLRNAMRDDPDRSEEAANAVAEDKRFEVRLTHRGNNSSFDLDFHEESTGTRALLEYARVAVAALENGEVVVVDEIDSSLHPQLLRHLVGVFADPDTNPRQAQLIFTTHDVSLLDSNPMSGRVLDRDQVWFTEKNESGSSTLYSAYDFAGTSEKSNVYRRYVLGQFGAMPHVPGVADALSPGPRTERAG